MNKTNLFRITGLSLVALAIGIFASSSIVSAQSTNNTGSQALEIAPPVITLTADPGQIIETQISLRDVSSGSLVVTGQVNDFTASGEDGTPKILMEEDEVSPYSMKSWVSPLSQLTLMPKQIKNFPLTITIPENAAPGGYYSVVRFTANPPDLEGTGVSLSASLGALILLRVNGDVKEELSIKEFSINFNGGSRLLFESTPLQFVERLTNTGNIHEEPSGQITITDMFGNKTAVLNINLPTRNVLPQSTRKFEQMLDKTVIGNKILFGKYTADLKITYGSDKEVITKSITFWVIPYTLIAVWILGLVGGFIGLRFAVKRYNKHIIRKAQKRRRSRR